MTTLYFLAGIAVIVALGIAVALRNLLPRKSQVQYRYKRRDFLLSRAERECYEALIKAVGMDYRVFVQVHLPNLLDNKVVGQNWIAAFRHINQKSVDFVLCDKTAISPKLAIELDDSSHQLPERQQRDREVERILEEAGLPLLRLANRGHFNPLE